MFTAKLERGAEGTWLATFPDLPEAITEGATKSEALANAADALAVALLGRMKDGEALPARRARPNKAKGLYRVPLLIQPAAKLAFYEAFRDAGRTRVALAADLGKPESEIRRMLDPSHPTKLPALEAAMRALGKRFVLDVQRD